MNRHPHTLRVRPGGKRPGASPFGCGRTAIVRAQAKPAEGRRAKPARRKCLLLAIDGTEHFASEKIGCASCTRRLLNNGKTRYSHRVMTPIIVSPEESKVISSEPAFVLPHDGEEKQDGELSAAKRWLTGQAPHLRKRMPLRYSLSCEVTGRLRTSCIARGMCRSTKIPPEGEAMIL